jgi:hypothetical protein
VGKGTIAGGGTSGYYQVTVNLNRTRITAGIAKANADIISLTALVSTTQGLIDASDIRLSSLMSQITGWEGDPAHKSDYDKAMADYQSEIVTRQGLVARKAYQNLKIVSAQKRIDFLNSAAADPVVDAWCADLTTDLSGVVGTVEVPGERGAVLIRPGYTDAAAFSATRDGQLQAAIGGTPESVFYNWAMLPGWQKWKPTHRTGQITAIAGDVCSVTLDAALSSAQSLDVNQTTTLSNVPIEYMT